MTMEEVSISEFKAKCLALVEQVRKTKKPIRITRHGKPVAEVVPHEADEPLRSPEWLPRASRALASFTLSRPAQG